MNRTETSNSDTDSKWYVRPATGWSAVLADARFQTHREGMQKSDVRNTLQKHTHTARTFSHFHVQKTNSKKPIQSHNKHTRYKNADSDVSIVSRVLLLQCY